MNNNYQIKQSYIKLKNDLTSIEKLLRSGNTNLTEIIKKINVGYAIDNNKIVNLSKMSIDIEKMINEIDKKLLVEVDKQLKTII